MGSQFIKQRRQITLKAIDWGKDYGSDAEWRWNGKCRRTHGKLDVALWQLRHTTSDGSCWVLDVWQTVKRNRRLTASGSTRRH